MSTTNLVFGVKAATGEQLAPGYPLASPAEIDAICEASYQSYRTYRSHSPAARATFLEKVAEEIMALGDALLQRAHEETALPLARLTGERGRTCGQLTMFANYIRAGKHNAVIHDEALPDRQPLPRSDLVRTLLPLGPIAVFGASNFPLAFSVAGGDTASALAAGCPVVVKAHPAHPGTSEMVAGAILRAAEATGMPAGVFSMVFADNDGAAQLVQHPRIRGVGFTGSQKVGLHLWRVANARAVPIPVFAEMGSINPVFVWPKALSERATAIAQAWVASLTLGAGQFCTNPGIIVIPEDTGADEFVDAVSAALKGVAAPTMLTSGIAQAYCSGISRLSSSPAVQPLSEINSDAPTPAVWVTTTSAFLANPDLQEEVFGPSGIIIRAGHYEEMLQIVDALPGQLTATLHIAEGETADEFVQELAEKAGRVLFNGFPTGVEVCDAMQHGGPFPATTDSRFTSVGTAAIQRWLRPVCFQDAPSSVLPG